MLDQARQLSTQLSAWRQEFHRCPELGFKEFKTAARAAEILAGLGCRVRTGVGRTGIMAELGQGDPIVAMRADMDALPILEANEVPYASQHPGQMHACGHDAHTAMACGVASLLADYERRYGPLPGTLRVLIQPSEEFGDAEGISGAPRMIADGALEGVQSIIALHVDPQMAVGDIEIAAGPASGGVDSFFASIYGEGGHGASPHMSIDPIYLAGHVVLAIHGIVSRRLDPFAPAVVTVGSIHGGQAENVIPEEVEISGTIRFMDPQVQRQIHTDLEHALQIARTLGGDYKLNIAIGTPPMINHAGVAQVIGQAASDLLGAGHLVDGDDNLGAEDFGCFSERVPGAMFNLGCRIEGDERFLHNPYFDLDEACLPVGAAVLAETALRLMQGKETTDEHR